MRSAGWHVLCVPPAVLHGLAADELPNVSIEAAECLLNGEKGAGILDSRANFQPAANAPIICQQSCNIYLAVSCYLAKIEAVECGAISGPLLQDGNPAQTGLSAFQYKELK